MMTVYKYISMGSENVHWWCAGHKEWNNRDPSTVQYLCSIPLFNTNVQYHCPILLSNSTVEFHCPIPLSNTNVQCTHSPSMSLSYASHSSRVSWGVFGLSYIWDCVFDIWFGIFGFWYAGFGFWCSLGIWCLVWCICYLIWCICFW